MPAPAMNAEALCRPRKPLCDHYTDPIGTALDERASPRYVTAPNEERIMNG
jgi:hypothetical protein